ncbi:MAG: chorismate synthase [Candidatus Saccharicenans sp.]|nr:chorismate synthase [Candidatus Saccharicenans sp.]MBP7870152.1 chorismate synthase [Candidatus Saccharicenans sp.]
MNSFGRLFRVHIYGESHGQIAGILIDGCPPGLPLKTADFEKDLARRKGGKAGTTSRVEADTVQIKSGLFNGRTTGAPLCLEFSNQEMRSKDYEIFKDIPRPGQADLTASQKFYGFNDYCGGGHFSGRLTVGLVAAGVVAKKIIRPVSVRAKLAEAGGEKNIQKAIEQAVKERDSVGGIIECRVNKVPLSLGEPFFDSVESLISHLIFSIPGVKAIEFGAGFASARMKGSEHNDLIISREGKTATNRAGGINGGLTNGNPLVFRLAVKPPASIPQPQLTFNLKTGQREYLEIKGRHDICIALRIPVIVEAVVAIVLADLLLLRKSQLV